jgi:hypothetical protein
VHCPGCHSCGIMDSFAVLFYKRVALVFREIFMNNYTLFVIFGYL